MGRLRLKKAKKQCYVPSHTAGDEESCRMWTIVMNKIERLYCTLKQEHVIKMLALVVLLFALCWMPLQTYYFTSTLIPSINQYQYINIIWFCFHWLAMSNSCCNPFIYAIYNDKFQREFRARLWCFRICHKRNRHDENGYSEASDFDRSKVRASYRFTNSRSVRYNQQSIYGGGRSGHRSNGKPDGNVNGRRNSSYHSRRSLQHRPADRTDSGESGHHPHPHYHRYLDVGPNYSGSGGTGDSQSNLSINSPPPSPVAIDATIAISELEAAATLRNGGIGEAPYLNGGSTISRSNSQEPPKSQTAVLSTSYCGPLVSLANNNVKTVTVVATETTCKL
ncbi:Tachykinin-like peptide receptor 99D [Orchesella cincta]|uniref:Tachykinin-like peptide receptor 99D n=1 Tax=Orchesella cincta TaxID=48709 RepID=A0A1D2MS36_ORCCI|nr:Tachykinin-like peptide receptor 99D [Orchesella cincta]